MVDMSLVSSKRMKLEQGVEVGCWSTLCDSDSNMELLLQCSGCGVARYCGEVCKERDRQRHENFCRGIAHSKRVKSLGSVIIPGMDMDNDTLSKMLSLTPTEHSSTKRKEQTFPNLKEHTSSGLREVAPLNLSLKDQNSLSLEEHILGLREETSTSLNHTSINLNRYTPLDLTNHNSPTFEKPDFLYINDYTPLNLTKYASPTLQKHTSLSLKEPVSHSLKKFKSPSQYIQRIEEYASHSIEHASTIHEEHISNILKENTSPNVEHTPPNIKKYTSTNLKKPTCPSLEEHASQNFEEHTSLNLEEDTAPSIDKSMCHYVSNDFNDSADKSDRFDPFNMRQDLNVDRQTVQESKLNVESVICILCKFMFPGGSRIEDFSEVFFTHLKDDHGILHNHLHLLESSMVHVTSTETSTVTSTETSTPPSTWTCEIPKSEERRKRIRGC